MYTDINDYIKRPRSERRSHLKLDEPCIEIGGNSTQFRGMIAHLLMTTIPKSRKIHACHACHNGKCSNVNHLYWGTHKDNTKDMLDNGRPSFHERTIQKLIRIHGEENYKEVHKKKMTEIGRKGGLIGGKVYSERTREKREAVKESREHDLVYDLENNNTWGRWERLASLWNVSHTQARRYVSRNFKELAFPVGLEPTSDD